MVITLLVVESVFLHFILVVLPAICYTISQCSSAIFMTPALLFLPWNCFSSTHVGWPLSTQYSLAQCATEGRLSWEFEKWGKKWKSKCLNSWQVEIAPRSEPQKWGGKRVPLNVYHYIVCGFRIIILVLIVLSLLLVSTPLISHTLYSIGDINIEINCNLILIISLELTD